MQMGDLRSRIVSGAFCECARIAYDLSSCFLATGFEFRNLGNLCLFVGMGLIPIVQNGFLLLKCGHGIVDCTRGNLNFMIGLILFAAHT